MEIGKKMNEGINKQINRELYSSYLYLAMAAYFDASNLTGFARWMRNQAIEESMHALKFYDFLNERGGRAEMLAIEAPQKEWKNTLDVFEETYKHELEVTRLIHNLVKIAKEENDYASESFLKWYVDEQVEEEASALDIVNKIKLMKDAPGAMIMLDAQLGKRAVKPAVFAAIQGGGSDDD